jgi:hypothetical protein
MGVGFADLIHVSGHQILVPINPTCNMRKEREMDTPVIRLFVTVQIIS